MRKLLAPAALRLLGAAPAILSAFVSFSAGSAKDLSAQVTPQVSEFYVSGVKVIHKQVTANDVVAMRLILNGGAAAITPAVAGIERLLAGTITRGTEKYSKDAFSELATTTGTEVGGGVALDYSTFSVLFVRQHMNEAWDLFTQATLHPTFPEAEVQQVRDQIVNDLKQRTDDPDSYLNLIADSLLYGAHPYAADPEGTEASIAKLGRDDLVGWHKRRMTKENLVLVVVGNVTRAEIQPRIAAAFASLPATGGATLALPGLPRAKSSVTTIERELPTNYIIGLYAAPGRSSPDYPAMQLATRVLDERLFEEVRTKRNLTYAVSARVTGARQSKGSLYVTAVAPDTTMKVIFSEVRKIQRQPVPTNRLRETISVYVTGYWMGQETNMGQAESLGLWEATGGGWRNARLFIDRMKTVTPADVQRVSAKYLKNARFVVIGDPKKVDRALFINF